MDQFILSGKMEAMSLTHQPTRLTEIAYSQQLLEEFQKHGYRKHLDQLHYVLKKHTEERNDTTFSRSCLFCRKHFTGNRSYLFEHLAVDHNFYLGALDNIVFANEFLDAINQKLENLQCIYCEKQFKDWNVLKEHMRKKFHKRINPKNKRYDMFYIQSYKRKLMNLSGTPEDQTAECSTVDSDDDPEDSYMECQDEDSVLDQQCVCLLCPETLPDFERTLRHMREVHNFDFMALKRLHRLSFYRQMKLCNYYRSRVCLNSCPVCLETFTDHSVLLSHMMSSGHVTQLPDVRHWDQPLYYSVTKDNDNFLCFLDDEYDDDDSVDDPVVLPENLKATWDPDLGILRN